MTNRQLIFLIGGGCWFFCFIGCGQVVRDTPFPNEIVTQHITAATGGTLSFADGTSLLIPAGALSTDETITLEKPRDISALPLPYLNTVYITSESTSLLNSSATLTLKYYPTNISTEESLVFAMYSSAVIPTTEGGEVNQIEYISPEAIDTSTGTISFKINHFSRAWLYKQRKFYLVLDIPTKYLKKGDILYVLTSASKNGTVRSGGRWLPGHAALYLGSEDPDATTNDNETVIESTKSSKKEGVQFNSFTESIKEASHIYLGAYRPKEMSLSASDRSNIARAAINRSTWGYSVIGSGTASGSSGINCVALVEDAYDDAGKSILSEAEENYLLPLEQFLKTETVSEISVEVGETANIGIIGVTDYGLIRSTYTDDPTYYTAEADAAAIDAGKASFYPGVFGYVLTFTPTTADAERAFNFTFHGQAGSGASSDKLLTINVGQAPTSEPGGDYLTIAALDPVAGTKITREVEKAISLSFNYKLTTATTGTFEVGKLHLEAGGMHGTTEVTLDNLWYSYGNATIMNYITDEVVTLGSGTLSFNFSVIFPAHDPGYTHFDYTPFVWAKLTRPNVTTRHFAEVGPTAEVISYTY